MRTICFLFSGFSNVLHLTGFFRDAFFWECSVDSYSGIRITEHTEYQFPKEQTLCYSENRIADVTKINRGSLGTQFSRRKNTITGYSVYSEQTAIPSISSILLSGAELTEYYSIHSGIRIGPKRTQLPSIPCILIPSPKRTRPRCRSETGLNC